MLDFGATRVCQLKHSLTFVEIKLVIDLYFFLSYFFVEFKAIPPVEETAKKLIVDFLGISLGTSGKRRVFLEDIVLVMDASGSIRECPFEKGRTAMQNLVKINRKNYINYWAEIVYSDVATIRCKFLPVQDAEPIIGATPYVRGGTNTQAGLYQALQLFKDSNSG